MKIGDKIRIVKCDVCSKVVGKVANITEITTIAGQDGVKVKFGRGRPQLGRPSAFVFDDIALVEKDS